LKGAQAQDIFAFLNGWFAVDIRSDFNADGTIAIQDIFDFLDAWFVGCWLTDLGMGMVTTRHRISDLARRGSLGRATRILPRARSDWEGRAGTERSDSALDRREGDVLPCAAESDR
jgi:hypothetical protein